MKMSNLTQSLDTVRRRWRRLLALRASARALFAAALVAAGAALAERWLQPSDGAALALAALAIIMAFAAMALFAWPVRRRPDDRQVARFVEEHCPDLDDAIVTAVDIQQRGDGGYAFAPLVIQSAAARLEAADLSRCVDPREIRIGWWRAGAGAAATVLALVVAAPLLERAAQVAYLRLFPGSISIQVRSGDMRVPAGRPVTIAAAVAGRRGTLTRVAPSVTLETAPGQTTTVPMVRAGDGYELRINPLERSFKYQVTAGPATSRAYAVTALHPSRVQRIELHYDYPSFTGLKPRSETDGGDVFGPAGTRVRLVVHADKAVSTGSLAFSEGKPGVPLARVNDRTLESTITVKEEAAFRVGLVDPDGLSSEGIEYFVRVMDDRPADVHILRPSGDTGITPLEEVPIEARADDDFGIASLDMVYSVSGGPEKVVPFTTLGGTEHRADRIPDARRRRSQGEAGRRDRLLRPGARHPARQTIHAVAQRDLLPRSEAVQRGVLPGAEPGDGGRRRRGPARRIDFVAERDHQRDLEPGAPLGRRTVGRRHQERRRRAGRVEGPRGTGGRAGADAPPHRAVPPPSP